MKILIFLLLTVQLAEARSKMKQFQLFSKCKGVHLSVEMLPERAERIKLTWEQVNEIAMKRLKKARLYVPRKFAVGAEEDFHPVLYISVNVSKTAFSLAVEFRKVVRDKYTGQEEYAVTWRIGVLGVHGFRNQFILRMVDKYVGIFIEEWSKVNKSYCDEEKTVDPTQGPIKPPGLVR